MILKIDANEEKFAKLNEDGTVTFPKAVVETSEDGLITTVTSKSTEALNADGYEEYATIIEGKRSGMARPVVEWKHIDGKLYKVISWQSNDVKDDSITQDNNVEQ